MPDSDIQEDPTYANLCATFPRLQSLPRLQGGSWAGLDIPKLPPNAVHGTLDNGICYYVLTNREPKKRCELQLLVGFGSLVEEDDQCGGAHLIEHLGFSATKKYENHQIIKFLESIGAQFGACQNAYTSFDETVYHLHVPTDQWELISESLSVLREFAFWTRLSPEDLDKEREVVLDEWRKSKNASGRLAESYTKAVACGCKYEHRLPIGTEEVIRGVSAQRLQDFYLKFYHPKRMAVVAVGDFEDEAKVVEEIRRLFDVPVSEINRSEDAPERPKVKVPPNDTPRFVIDTDPELSMSVCIVESKQAKKDITTVADFREDAVRRLFYHVLNNRLYKVTMRPENREFYQASLQQSAPIPPLEGVQLAIIPADGRILAAIEIVLKEVERAKAHGLYEEEVSRARQSMLSEFEEALIEKDQTNSSDLAGEFVGLYLRDSPMPGIEWECRMIRDILEVEGPQKITAAEVGEVAKAFVGDKNSVIKFCEPKKFLSRFRQRLPSEQEILAVLQKVRGETLDPWPREEDDPSTRIHRLFKAAAEEAPKPQTDQELPRPREVQTEGFSEEVDKTLGHEVVLRNGVRVFLKATDFFDDLVTLRGTSWGGFSEFMEKDQVLTEAMYCTHIATELGLYGMRPEALNESLEGLRMSPPVMGMDAYRGSIAGDCSPANLPELLMLLHLLFVKKVQPKPEYLQNVMQMLREYRQAEDRDPYQIYQKRCDAIVSCDHPYYRRPPLSKIQALDFDKACSIYNNRLDDPSAWTFVIVGNLPSLERMMQLLTEYVESIPQGPTALASPKLTADTITPLYIPFPQQDVKEDVRVQMVDPQCQVLLAFPLTLDLPTEAEPFAEQLQLCTLASLWRLLEKKLQERLRFEMGKTYNVSVGDSFGRSPPKRTIPRRGVASIGFSCDPSETQMMIEAVIQELSTFRNDGFREEDVDSIKEQEKRNFEKLVRDNGFWEGTVSNLYCSRLFPVAPVNGDIGKAVKHWKANYDACMSSFSKDIAQEFLAKYLPEGGVSARVSMAPKRSLASSLAFVCDRRQRL